MKTIFALLLITAIFAIGFFAYGRENTWAALFGKADMGPFQLADLTRSINNNDALICTPGLCPEGVAVDEEFGPVTGSPEEIILKIEKAFAASGLIYQRVDDQNDPTQARFVTWTKTMRFPDTNQFMAKQLGDGTTGLIAYARAQIGKSDLGNNLKRLNMIFKYVTDDDFS